MKHQTDPLTPEESAALESPSQDHSARCPLDQRIRDIKWGNKSKYVLKDRPLKGPALWLDISSGTGEKFTVAQIIAREHLKA
jgi:hypothetical protein